MNMNHIIIEGNTGISSADASEIQEAVGLSDSVSELFARNEEERFVMVLRRKEKKSGGGGNNEYRCRYCGLKITGGPAKIRGHFVNGVEGGQRVKKCTAPSDPNIPGNNSEAVNFVCNKRKANEGITGRQYKKRVKTCGLSQEKLDLHNWIDNEQRCTVRKKDGTICGCYYSAHSSAPRPPSDSNSFSMLQHGLLESSLEGSGDEQSLHHSSKVEYDDDMGFPHPQSCSSNSSGQLQSSPLPILL